MPKMIQIRNVPDRIHRKLKVRAAEAGMSLSDFLLRELETAAELPTYQELRERLARQGTIAPGVDSADAVRRERDSR